ncbi:carbamoyltransferase HypF [Schinkia sp. CFF1]
MPKAILVRVKGRVQGVGFRPYVYKLAKKYELKGTVQNNMDGVHMQLEGGENVLQCMLDELENNAPRISRIDSIEVEDIPYSCFEDFTIIPSERTGTSSLVIPVDASVCDDCLKEMRDSSNYRYQYPFINCTQCGPRYTIIDELPYDRPYTVMREFEMCDKCRKEYEDPTNRRHHAQPIACPDCGPKIALYSIFGVKEATEYAAIQLAREHLKAGKIIAIKGIGGYHLACDATNQEAIQELRKRKTRPQKPLAIMAGNLTLVQTICEVDSLEEKALTSTEAPIVVLQQKKPHRLPKALAPGINTLGIMLPYTPLHHLLFDESQLGYLVVTSANPSGMPMLYKEEEAFSYLRDIADYILTGNREIKHPIDDSVVQVIDSQITFLRRARGFVPDPIFTKNDHHGVLALGPQQKNTFAIGRKQEIFVGPHIGDMNHYNMLEHFTQELNHLLKWMGPFENYVIAVDQHPGYTVRELLDHLHSTRVVEVQHHHAHHVSCMVENEVDECCFGIILDGTGYGDDGNLWGFEILYGNAERYKRLAHLRYSPLPGGEKAIKEPWRIAVGMLVDHFGLHGKRMSEQLFPEKIYEIGIIHNMVEKNLNSPLAGSCGRLFDAVSAILGVCTTTTYDGEAAIKLSEQLGGTSSLCQESYHYQLNKVGELLEIDFSICLLEIVDDYRKGREKKEIIQAFHETIVNACVECIVTICSQFPEDHRKVVFSGGSFHNPFLATKMKRLLEMKGFQVYTHKQVPCNDGGLSLGQLKIAWAQSTKSWK